MPQVVSGKFGGHAGDGEPDGAVRPGLEPFDPYVSFSAVYEKAVSGKDHVWFAVPGHAIEEVAGDKRLVQPAGGNVYPPVYLWHIDQSGAELGRVKLERQAERVLVDDGQQFYAVSGASVLVLDQRQQLQFTLDAKGGTAPQPVRLSSGQAGFLVKQGDTGAEVRTVDPAAQKWGEAYPLPEECAAVYPGSGEYLFFCTSGQTLCGWNTERKTLVQLASWLDAGIHASALRAVPCRISS